MKVRLLKLGHAAKEVEVPAGATAEEAIKASGFEIDGFACLTNGVGAMLSSPVHDGDVIVLSPKVEGGAHRVPGVY
jgi:sulfur carrier protein ThiS